MENKERCAEQDLSQSTRIHDRYIPDGEIAIKESAPDVMFGPHSLSLNSEKSDQTREDLQRKLLENQLIIEEQKETIDSLRYELRFLEDQLNDVQHLNSYFLNTTCWKITAPLRSFGDWTKKRKNLFRLDAGQRRLAPKEHDNEILEGSVQSYLDCKNRWIFTKEQLEEQKHHYFSQRVKFSVLVPVYNTPENYLNEMIASVRAQTYPVWELCLADASDAEHLYVGKICKNYSLKDARIKYKKLESNLGISANTNECLKMSTGDYLALLDHDDVLHPAALYEILKPICDCSADFIYTDEALFKENPRDAYMPHYKPDYAPDTLLSVNYICHLTAFSRALADKVGEFRSEYDGSQDHDYILRAALAASCIAHVPEVLYFWRVHTGSVALGIENKYYAVDAGKKAVLDHIHRVGREGSVTSIETYPTMYRIHYTLTANPKTSILIPNCDHVADLRKCLISIFNKTTYDNFEVVVIENNSTSEVTFDYYRLAQKEYGIKVLYWKGDFNFSAICNYGAANCEGEVLLFLNNDTEIETPGWLEELLMYAQRKDVGAVGAKLCYPNGMIQHAGVLLGCSGIAGHYFPGSNRRDIGYMGRLQYAQDLTAVTGACLMVRRSVFNEVEGFNQDFAVAFNDVDFCLRLRKIGYRNVWTPFAELIHYESKSRGPDTFGENRNRFEKEVALFQHIWLKEIAQGDPYYNPNFNPNSQVFALLGRSGSYPARITRKESGVF